LIQGAEILNLIEKVSTYYENPVRKIEITNCGEFSLCPQPDEDYIAALNPPFETLFNLEIKGDDVDSILSWTGYKSGKYCLKTDLKPYLPFTRYSRMFDSYFKEIEVHQHPEAIDDIQRLELEKIAEPIEEEVEPPEKEMTVDQLREQMFAASRTFYVKHVIM
jgi:hypothetical protein